MPTRGEAFVGPVLYRVPRECLDEHVGPSPFQNSYLHVSNALRITIRRRTERYSNLHSRTATESQHFQGVQQNLSRDLRELLGATRNLEACLERERRQKWVIHATM
jgi:hypothetical protein